MRALVSGPTPILRLVLLGFAALAMTAGALLFIGANETERWFSWTIQPPLSAAALGAFYWAASVLLFTAARSPSWVGARPIVYPVLAIALTLLVVTLIHLERFDMDSLFGVFWLCAYIVAPLLLVAGIATARADAGGEPGRPLPGSLRAALLAEGLVMLAIAALMLAAPEEAAEIWPWALTPLTSRALGAFVGGVALVALMVTRADRLVLFAGTAVAYALLGALQLLALALHGGDLGGDDVATAVYIAWLALIVATGTYGSSAARAFSSS